MAIRLPYHLPLDWSSMLEFLGARSIGGVELLVGERYRRTIRVGELVGTIDVGPAARGRALELRVELPGPTDSRPIVERVRRLFDLDAEPDRIEAELSRDELLAETVSAHPGLRLPGCWDGFELAVRAVLGQQVTVRGAATLGRRLVEAYGAPIERRSDGLGHLFPTPEALRVADLSEVGLPRRRAATIRRLAHEVAAGRLSFVPGSERAAFVAGITAIPGIGDWTAQYVAMRALRDPDAFPAGDLVLLKTAGRPGKLTARELATRAEAWRPWRAYAAVHLWKASGSRSRL